MNGQVLSDCSGHDSCTAGQEVFSHFPAAVEGAVTGLGTFMTQRCAVTTRMVAGMGALFLLSCLCGCVERTVTINTEPQGATVVLNDQEVGHSPVKVPFTWYGDYDIILRRQGYQTIQTHHRIRAPWYEWPMIDITSELLVPFTLHDDRVLDTFVLQSRQEPSVAELLERAEELREQALSEETE